MMANLHPGYPNAKLLGTSPFSEFGKDVIEGVKFCIKTNNQSEIRVQFRD